MTKRGMSNPFSAIMTAISDIRDKSGLIETSPASERLDGKTCFITGANSGLGKAIAIELGRRGASLVLGLRSKVEETVAELKSTIWHDDVIARYVDLSDLKSVDHLIAGFVDDGVQFDRVILNAGLMSPQAKKSAQGFETMLAVHWLANQRLITEMLEKGIVPKGQGARIIAVSSESHRSAPPLDAETFTEFREHSMSGAMKQYGHSKLVLNLGFRGLAERYSDTDIGFFHLCPGPVNSNIARESPAALRAVVGVMMGWFFPTPAKAAEPVIYLACSPDMDGRSAEYMHLMRFKPPSDTSMDKEAMDAVLKKGEAAFTQL
ncbi:MAG: SDR family NAD(P)-dependent oxidoreductase [Pseudomonadota bacterium]